MKAGTGMNLITVAILIVMFNTFCVNVYNLDEVLSCLGPPDGSTDDTCGEL